MPMLEKFAKTFDSYPLEQAAEPMVDGKPRGKAGKDYARAFRALLDALSVR